jgi:hypothetical protein
MAVVAFIGKRGSKACREIREDTGIRLYLGKKRWKTPPDVLINYGLTGRKLDALLRKIPSARGIPTINGRVGISKYSAVQAAKKIGVPVPDSRETLPKSARLGDWIEKRHNSSRGFGIRKARGRGRMAGKYYQQMIKDRRFELRVHSFLWVPSSEWKLSKRHGPADQITWNFHQGGHFSTVRRPNDYPVFLEAKEIATKVLKQRGMGFGAVDLIVDNNMKVWFIEVNSSPGFTELNRPVYANAFNKLKKLSGAKARSFASRRT